MFPCVAVAPSFSMLHGTPQCGCMNTPQVTYLFCYGGIWACFQFEGLLGGVLLNMLPGAFCKLMDALSKRLDYD